jgi:hypothetical protein
MPRPPQRQRRLGLYMVVVTLLVVSRQFRSTRRLDLYVRLVGAKARFAAIPKILVRVLVGKDQAARRGGLRHVRKEARFRAFCWTSGFISFRQYVLSTAAYAAFRLAGPTIRGYLYRTVRTQGPTKNA